MNMSKILKYFLVNFPELAEDMQKCNHHVDISSPNSYHIGEDILAHTLLVAKMSTINSNNRINNISALLHDLGKPLSSQIHKKDSLKKTFYGHEGLSFYLAIEVLNKMMSDDIITRNEMKQILTIISLHGSLFDRIKDGEMYKPDKIFDMFDDVDTFSYFVNQVKNDYQGRFYESEDKVDVSNKLGISLFTKEQFMGRLFIRNKKPHIKKDRTINVLVGISNVGKSTYLEKQNLENTIVISRDSVLMNYAKDNNIIGTRIKSTNCDKGYFIVANYNQVWNILTDKQQKEIDSLLQKSFQLAVKDNKNIIIDMTNVSIKSRRKWLGNVKPNYEKIAILFVTSYNEVIRRNNMRLGKKIPYYVIKNKASGFNIPTYAEVDTIEWVF